MFWGYSLEKMGGYQKLKIIINNYNYPSNYHENYHYNYNNLKVGYNYLLRRKLNNLHNSKDLGREKIFKMPREHLKRGFYGPAL